MEIIESLGQGFAVIFSQYNILVCVLAAGLGVFLAFLPGISPTTAIAIVLPFCFGLPPVTGIVVLVSLCFGTQYGRAAAACYASRGPATGRYTSLAPIAFAALVGALVAVLLVAALVPAIARSATLIGPSEYAVLIIVFFAVAAALAPGSMVRALAAIIAGVVLHLIGSNQGPGTWRLDTGIAELSDGISLIALVLGILLLPDIVSRLGAAVSPVKSGALPNGLEPDNREPSGQESARSLSLATAAASAGLTASFLPLLSWGLPLNLLAVFLGGLLTINGIVPGPQIGATKPDIIGSIFATIVAANVVALIVMLASGRLFAHLCRMNSRIVAPAILVLACLTTYTLNNSPIDVLVMMSCGLIGCLLLQSNWERGSLVTGFILGPILEQDIQRAMLLARDNIWGIMGRPLVDLLLAAGLILLVIIAVWRRKRLRKCHR